MQELSPGGLKAPPEWPELLEIAGQALEAPGQPADFAGTANLVSKAQDLSKSQLDANRYYAEGQVVCGVAQSLQHEDLKSTLITYGEACLRDRFNKGQSLPEALKGRALQEVFVPVAHHSAANLPPAARLLGEALTLVTFDRIVQRYEPELSSSGSSQAFVGLISDTARFDEGSVMPSLVGHEALSGPALVIAAIIDKTEGEPGQHITEEQLEQIKHPSVIKAAKKLARVHLAQEAVGEAIRIVNGEVVVDEPERNLFRSAFFQNFENISYFIRSDETKLTCPAVPARIVSLAMDMSVAMVERASAAP